jgi:hypothetical protein
MRDVFDHLKFQKSFLIYLGFVQNDDGADNVNYSTSELTLSLDLEQKRTTFKPV